MVYFLNQPYLMCVRKCHQYNDTVNLQVLIQCQKLTHRNLPLFFSSRKIKYRYRPGTTPVMTEKVVPLKLEVVQESVQQMDTA